MRNSSLYNTVRKILVLIVSAIVLGSQLQWQSPTDPAPLPPPSWAPQLVPAAPNAAKMTEYYAQRPNMYTGTANVSVPLYTLDFEGWKLPLSLSYNATGLRPNEEASEVGLGWALTATGVISRSINGLDDVFPGEDSADVRRGYVFASKPVSSVMGFEPGVDGDEPHAYPYSQSYYTYLLDSSPDTQPDIFNYNFFGYSGSFTLSQKVVDTTIQVVKLTEDACQIFYHENTATFTVITPQGYKGTFAVKEKSTTFSAIAPEGTSVSNSLECCSQRFIDIEHYTKKSGQFRTITSWYLQRIVSPRGKVLRFTYDLNSNGSSTYLSLSRNFGEFPDPESPRMCIQTIHEHVYLTRIESDDIAVDLTMEFRDDVRKNTLFMDSIRFPFSTSKLKRYTGIQIQSLIHGSTFKKIIKFQQSYFNQTYFDARNDTDNEADFMRGRLDRVTIDDQEYNFSYHQPDALPHKMTSALDHFGFYNGVTQQNDMLLPPIPHTGYQFIGSTDNFFELYDLAYYVANNTRHVDPDYGSIGVLNKVVYPTRGYSKFEYEAHRYTPDILMTFREYNPNPAGNPGGGTRIKSITDYNNNDSLVRKKLYKYSLYPDSSLVISTGKVMTPLYNRYAFRMHNPSQGEIDWNMYYRTHAGIPGSSSAQGKLIGYDRVHEIVTGKEKSYRNFYQFENTPNKVLDNNSTASGRPNVNGQTKRVINFNSDGKAVQMRYDSLYNNVTGVVKGWVYEEKTNNAFLLYHVPYELERTFVTPKKVVTIMGSTPSSIDLDVQEVPWTFGNSLRTTVETSYSDTTFLLRSQKTTNSYGETLTTFYKRPYDYSSPSDALEHMKNAEVNMVEPIIEEVWKRNGNIINARANLYGLVQDTLVNLLSSYALNATRGNFISDTTGGAFTSPYELKVSFNEYDPDGRLLEYKTSDGVLNSFIWGYNNTLPVVHGLDINHSKLSQAHTESLGPNYEANIRAHANTKGKQISTYQHNPLVGVSQITNVNGFKKTFQYDENGRLKLIKDHHENALRQNRYHFIERAKTRILSANSSLDFGTMVKDYFFPTFLPYDKCGSATRTLTLTNEGQDDLEVYAINLPDGFHVEWNGSISNPTNLVPGGSTDITVYFNYERDTLNAGTFSGDIEIISNKTSGIESVPITATYLNRICNLTIPSIIDMGATTGSGIFNQNYQITNNGNGPLRISSVTATVPQTQTVHPDFNITHTMTCLAPETSGNLTISFTAHGTLQSIATVTIQTDVTGCPATQIQLKAKKN